MFYFPVFVQVGEQVYPLIHRTDSGKKQESQTKGDNGQQENGTRGKALCTQVKLQKVTPVFISHRVLTVLLSLLSVSSDTDH